MKLTNEAVAKALGWSFGFPDSEKRAHYSKDHWFKGEEKGLPAFTTSLDAIVAEIEARGLGYNLDCAIGNAKRPFAQVWDRPRRPATSAHESAHGKTAPLALCAALLAYLKSTHKEVR